MSAAESPCKHCTEETGRGPGCHTEACPHGWADWDRMHRRQREAIGEAKRMQKNADSLLAEGAIKNRKKRGRQK